MNLLTDELPLRFLGRQWYLRKRLPSGKRLERGLGTANKAEAERRAKAILHEALREQHNSNWEFKVTAGLQPKGWLWRMNSNAGNRCRKKGGAIDLNALELIAMRSGGLCEVSGLPFYLGDEPKHPFKPSLDRIDSSGGYDAWNVRMVLLSVNYCMSHWGEKVFLQISAATLSRHLAKLSQGGVYTGFGDPKKTTDLVEKPV